MKDNDLLMIVLAFFLGFCFRKMMRGQLIEGKSIDLTGLEDKVEFNSCVATQNNERYDHVNLVPDNVCYNKSYGECLNLMKYGGVQYLNNMPYSCTPKADEYIRQNENGECPDDYIIASDTGYTTKVVHHSGIPEGCTPSNECGFLGIGCWNKTVCDTNPHNENINDETKIPLCVKKNIYNIGNLPDY